MAVGLKARMKKSFDRSREPADVVEALLAAIEVMEVEQSSR
jgi:hypothetical protein